MQAGDSQPRGSRRARTAAGGGDNPSPQGAWAALALRAACGTPPFQPLPQQLERRRRARHWRGSPGSSDEPRTFCVLPPCRQQKVLDLQDLLRLCGERVRLRERGTETQAARRAAARRLPRPSERLASPHSFSSGRTRQGPRTILPKGSEGQRWRNYKTEKCNARRRPAARLARRAALSVPVAAAQARTWMRPRDASSGGPKRCAPLRPRATSAL